MESLLGDLAKRDAAGVELVNKVLDGVTRRLVLLTKQLSVESSLRKRPTVLIGHSDSVNFGEGK